MALSDQRWLPAEHVQYTPSVQPRAGELQGGVDLTIRSAQGRPEAPPDGAADARSQGGRNFPLYDLHICDLLRHNPARTGNPSNPL
jgi:hypothetical protein